MSYNLAYSVLTPITNGETGLQLNQGDARVLDSMVGITYGEALPSTTLFGMSMSGWSGYYFCGVVLKCPACGADEEPALYRATFGTLVRTA